MIKTTLKTDSKMFWFSLKYIYTLEQTGLKI